MRICDNQKNYFDGLHVKGLWYHLLTFWRTLQATWTLTWLRYWRLVHLLASVLFLHCQMEYRGVLAPNIVTVHHRGLICAPEISLLVQLAFQDLVDRDVCLLSVIVSRESRFAPFDPLDPTLSTNLLT